MRIYMAAAIVAMFASNANADINGVITTQTVEISQFLLGAPNNTFSAVLNVGNGGEASQFYTNLDGFDNYNNYQTSTTIQPNYIDFANNSTSSGPTTSLKTTTAISVTYTNTSGRTLSPTLDSTILPGGFGFYAANPASYDPGYVPDINKLPESDTDSFLNFNNYSGADPLPLGAVSFEFDILSGAKLVASYTASLNLSVANCCYNQVIGDLVQNAGAASLNNFHLVNADDPNKALGYQWDATAVSVALGELAPGESSTFTYLTIVSSQSYSAGDESNGQALIAYSGFGDPLGNDGGGIGDPSFPQLQISLPTFDNGTGAISAGNLLGYEPDVLPITHYDADNLPSDVPEPATWTMLLVGSGALGGVLRRQRLQLS